LVQQSPRPRPAPQPPANGDYFFPPPPPTPGRTAQGRTNRPLNLAIGNDQNYTADAPRRNPSDQSSEIQVRGAQVGTEWVNGLYAWWLAHRYYPDEAARAGESGVVQIHLKVDRSGKVTAVDLVSRSGSVLLDAAAMSTWRNAKLAPFPANTPENSADIDLTVNYILTR
jgi:TonB family protein